MAKKDKKIEEVVEEAPEPEPVAAPEEERFIVYKKHFAINLYIKRFTTN